MAGHRWHTWTWLKTQQIKIWGNFDCHDTVITMIVSVQIFRWCEIWFATLTESSKPFEKWNIIYREYEVRARTEIFRKRQQPDIWYPLHHSINRPPMPHQAQLKIIRGHLQTSGRHLPWPLEWNPEDGPLLGLGLRQVTDRFTCIQWGW